MNIDDKQKQFNYWANWVFGAVVLGMLGGFAAVLWLSWWDSDMRSQFKASRPDLVEKRMFVEVEFERDFAAWRATR